MSTASVHYPMTNDELEQAIAMAFAMVGRSASTEQRHHAAMQHLNELMQIQRKRATAAVLP